MILRPTGPCLYLWLSALAPVLISIYLVCHLVCSLWLADRSNASFLYARGAQNCRNGVSRPVCPQILADLDPDALSAVAQNFLRVLAVQNALNCAFSWAWLPFAIDRVRDVPGGAVQISLRVRAVQNAPDVVDRPLWPMVWAARERRGPLAPVVWGLAGDLLLFAPIC